MARVVLFTGAGTSAESGIPTFRTEDNSLWKTFDINTLCNFNTFRNNRSEVCEFYNTFRKKIAETQPHEFHHFVKKWQDNLKERDISLIVITQNVDDLFEKAGIENVVHIHGDIRYMQCIGMNHKFFIGYKDQKIDTECPSCICKTCKPGVVFFNEKAPLYADVYKLLTSLTRKDALLVIGTSCSVFPIHEFTRNKKSYQIYSAMELSDSVKIEDFDNILLGRCSATIKEIKAVVEIHLEEMKDVEISNIVRRKRTGKHPTYW